MMTRETTRCSVRARLVLATVTGAMPISMGCETEPEPEPEPDASQEFPVGVWPTHRRTLAHTASINAPVTLPLAVRWTRDLELGELTFGVTSAVGGRGKLYVGGDSQLFALDPADGTTVWSFAADGLIRRSAVLFNETKETSRVYFGSSQGTETHLYALDAGDGSMLWTTSHAGAITSAPAVASQWLYYTTYGTTIDGDLNQGILRAVQRGDGSFAWEASDGGGPVYTPLHAQGKVYTAIGGWDAAGDPYSYAARSQLDGSIAWTLAFAPSGQPGQGNYPKFSNGVVDTDVEIGEEPVLFIATGTNPATLHAIAANSGEVLWQVALPDTGWVHGLAITQEREDNALVVAQTSHLYRFDRANGDVLWQYEFANNATGGGDGSVVPRPAIWGDYVFHVVDGRSRLVAVSLETGAEAWSFDLDDGTTASPMVTGHSLYLGTHAGTLYALSPEAE